MTKSRFMAILFAVMDFVKIIVVFLLIVNRTARLLSKHYYEESKQKTAHHKQ